MDCMQLQPIYDEFLDFLVAERNASPLTISSYLTDFHVLNEYFTINKIESQLELLTTPILRRYVTYLKNKKDYKTNTIRRKIHSLSSFFQYALEMEYITKNPMLPIHAPKESKSLPNYMSTHELKLLLSAPKRFARFPEHHLRDTVLLELLIFTGMRKSELLNLKWDDVDFGRNTLLINGKGSRQRLVPMIEPLLTDLWDYLNTRLPLTCDYVIISDNDTRMSTSNIQTLFVRYLKKSGLQNKGYTLHKCRHSYASLLHQNGVDILTIKELLGHADLNSTKIYTHTSVKHLEDEVKKFPLIKV